jgi:hypothetical protein
MRLSPEEHITGCRFQTLHEGWEHYPSVEEWFRLDHAPSRRDEAAASITSCCLAQEGRLRNVEPHAAESFSTDVRRR